MDRIVGGFLNFARPERDEVGAFSSEDIGELIGSTVALAEKDPRFCGGVRLKFDVDDSLPPVTMDRDRICEVLWNLLLNAQHAVGPIGQVKVSVTACERHGSTGIIVHVDDSGPGIPPDLRGAVFTPFETTKPNGTGLGLALSKQILDSHRGTIEIGDSELGGAQVSFWLPQKSSHRPE